MPDHYITYAKTLTASLAIILVIVGWLFTLLVEKQRVNGVEIKHLTERVVTLEAHLRFHEEFHEVN